MLSRKIFCAAALAVLCAAAFALTATTPPASAQDRRPQTTATPASLPPTVVLEADAESVSVCPGDPTPRVALRANARSPEGREIRYDWRRRPPTIGRIEGEGANTVWVLENAQPGRVYVAYVEVNTGLAGDACMAFTSVPVAVRECPPARIVCPNVVISCPDTVKLGQPVTFTADVSGGTAGINATYNWTVTAGNITSGQGTTSITVDTTNLGGQTITATFQILGYNQKCDATCTTQVPTENEEKRFDEYREISYNDEKARLDNFAAYLQREQRAVGYITYHRGQPTRRVSAAGRLAQARRRAERARDYLVNERYISADRVQILEGGEREVTTFELRGVPAGAPPPRP